MITTELRLVFDGGQPSASRASFEASSRVQRRSKKRRRVVYEQVSEWPTKEPHLRRTNLAFHLSPDDRSEQGLGIEIAPSLGRRVALQAFPGSLGSKSLFRL